MKYILNVINILVYINSASNNTSSASVMLRLLHMMNVRFSLLNMAQRILGVTLPNI